MKGDSLSEHRCTSGPTHGEGKSAVRVLFPSTKQEETEHKEGPSLKAETEGTEELLTSVETVL